VSIVWRVLGDAGSDNAAYARIETGQAIHRLLLDCGEGCLSTLDPGEVRTIDHLLFSHLHMDHIGGFDSFFRVNYNRPTRPVGVWGPPETIRILHHRFRGFLWNLYEGEPGVWRVHEVYPDRVETARFDADEAFATLHGEETYGRAGRLILDEPAYTVEAFQMNHQTPSLAYVVREQPRLNIDERRLADLGLAPGVWLRQLKAWTPENGAEITIAGASHEVEKLRDALLVETPGESLAYLTDFLLDEPAQERLAPALRGVETVICECQYLDEDADLAARNYHMTPSAVATLARRADVGRLILFHVSARYRRDGWMRLLAEARTVFPRTDFPPQWEMDS
jgi:ribonuclease Z